jgi:hypothetical protein
MPSTTIAKLIEGQRLARLHPDTPCIRADWCTTWTGTEFRRWFLECLHRKINANGDLLCPDEERYADLAHDARVVNDYIGRRIRNTGSCRLLRDLRMRRRYPYIDDQHKEE